jgi:hypothetical protein
VTNVEEPVLETIAFLPETSVLAVEIVFGLASSVIFQLNLRMVRAQATWKCWRTKDTGILYKRIMYESHETRMEKYFALCESPDLM